MFHACVCAHVDHEDQCLFYSATVSVLTFTLISLDLYFDGKCSDTICVGVFVINKVFGTNNKKNVLN